MSDGKIIFKTIDTKATTSTRWKTVGFTICREKTNGNPNKVKERAVVRLDSANVKSVIKDKKVYVTFTIDEEIVNRVLKDAKLSEIIKENDTLYFNGIFSIIEGGTEVKGEEYNTLNSIKYARAWNNRNDFAQHFDMKVIYKGSKKLHPISIEYQLYKNNKYKTIGKENLGKQKVFTKFITNNSNIPMKKENYYITKVYYVLNEAPSKKLDVRSITMNPKQFYEEYIKEVPKIRDRKLTVDSGGIKIYAIYQEYQEYKDNENKISRELEEIEPNGMIAADTRGKEKFDVETAIPTSEKVYTNIIAKDYLMAYSFVKRTGIKYYDISVSKDITIKYFVSDSDIEESISRESSKTITQKFKIPRKYSYWVIDKFEIYKIKNAEIHTKALKNTIQLNPKNYVLPKVIYQSSIAEKDHIIEPKIKNITLSSSIYNQDYFPSFDFREIAENSIGEIECKNDKLIFNGQEIMSDVKRLSKTDRPKQIIDNSKDIDKDVLFQENIQIPMEKRNGEYITTAQINYEPYLLIHSSGKVLEYNVDINNMKLHTPVICNGFVENKYIDNQMISPELNRISLVLDLPFRVDIPTLGEHLNYKGYGIKDYKKYIKTREVKFPFDVYKGKITDGVFIPKNIWTQIHENTEFYLPKWVDEGLYSIEFRSLAMNVSNNLKEEKSANFDWQNDVAIDRVDVQISGRIYDLNIYDISDYPLWENVFRENKGTANLSGFKYTVGTKNQNGKNNNQNSKYTIPLVNGSHPNYKNIGVIKAGYYTRFSLRTIGNMYGKNDFIRIKPKFYYVDEKGRNRQEVNIYYTETINKKKSPMIKMGSSLDLQNKKSIKTGSTFLSMNEKELNQTAKLLSKSLDEIKSQNKITYTFTNIMISPSLRTFVGYCNKLPNNISRDKVALSEQKWYGEYYIPSDIHIAPKNYDIKSHIGKKGAINYKESFWLKEGYIIVNFDIETIKEGKRYLSYINPINSQYGYCNMWKREGFLYEKYDDKDNLFKFTDGDYIIYYIDKSASKDWTSSGTH